MVTLLNDTRRQIPFSRSELELSIIARFDKIVSLQPAHMALTGNGQFWTYEQLQRRTEQIAVTILQRARPGSGCVAYLAHHSPQMVIIALSILRAGKAFLCVHPGLPLAAKQEVIDDAAPELILCTAQHYDAALSLARAYGHCDVQLIEDISEAIATTELSKTECHSPAVVFYTSGSTGKPKGIVKSHRAILHRAWLAAMDDGVCPSDRQSLLTFCSFASSEADTFGCLLNGATLELFDAANHGLTEFGTWVDERRITILHPPVAWFRRYLSSLHGKDLHPSLRLVALAGDSVLPKDVQQWRQKFSPHCALRHRFSSTEAGHMAVACLDTGQVPESGEIPAARPVSDKSLYIVGEENIPLPVGEAGELVVRSAFLSDGYWRRPHDTAAHFTSDAEFPTLRYFATGDLGYLNADGGFVFLGRKDGQVKIRGYRVEVGEIESALLQLPDVGEAAVIVDRREEEPRLVAFVVVKPGAQFDAASLRKLLSVTLPPWKVPLEVHFLETLPLALTGKIDRQNLHALMANFGTQPEYSLPTCVNGKAGLTIDRLTQIWQDLFPRTQFGPDDDFFELGGNSMLSLTLSVRVSSAFNVNWPYNTPYQCPTITRMAALIDDLRANGSVGSPHLRTLKLLTPSASFYPPLYIVPGDHGIGVEPVSSGMFVDFLSTELTAYALVARSADGKTPGHKTVSAMAADYIEAIRIIQPTGPYILLGGCIGAAIAFEMARQLEQSGDKVSLLMIDGSYMTTLRQIPDSLHKFATSMYLREFPNLFRKRLKTLARASKKLQRRHMFPYLLRVVRTLYDEIEATFYAKTDWILFTRQERFQLQYRKAIRRYRPGRYSGNIKLLLTSDYGKRTILKDWQRVAGGGVQVEYLACIHGEHLKAYADQSAMFTKRAYKQALAEHDYGVHSGSKASSFTGEHLPSTATVPM